jgi:hypothetical protein
MAVGRGRAKKRHYSSLLRETHRCFVVLQAPCSYKKRANKVRFNHPNFSSPNWDSMPDSR